MRETGVAQPGSDCAVREPGLLSVRAKVDRLLGPLWAPEYMCVDGREWGLGGDQASSEGHASNSWEVLAGKDMCAMLSREQGWERRKPDSGWGQKSNLGLGSGLDGAPAWSVGRCPVSCQAVCSRLG